MNCLKTCHPDLITLANEVIKHVDISIIAGHRSKEEQDDLFHKGMSKLKFPESKHNKTPSEAFDWIPYPVDWRDIDKFQSIAFFIKGVAAANGIKIRLGCDWNGNFKTKDHSFLDFPHVELVEPRILNKHELELYTLE